MLYDDDYLYDDQNVFYDMEGYPVPITSDLSLTSVAYDANLLTLTWVCVAGAENQYAPTGKLELDDGGGMAEPAGTYTAWTDTGGVLTLLAALAAGTYAARLTNGDGEVSNTLPGEIVVAAARGGAHRRISGFRMLMHGVRV